MRRRGHKKEFARCHPGLRHFHRAFQAEEEGEGRAIVGGPRTVEFPLFDREVRATHNQLALRPNELRLEVAEVNRAHRLLDVQSARPAHGIGPPPIVDPISSVAVFLDLDDQVAAPDGVETSARDEKAVARFDLKTRDHFGDAAVAESTLELRGLDAASQPGENFRPFIRGREIPDFTLALPA